MASIQKISGVLANTGPAAYIGGRAESAAVYDYLRIEGEDGREHYLEKVAVPSYLDATLAPGAKGNFYIVTINFPKMFCSHQLRYLFATSSDGKLRQAIPQAARCVTDGNLWEALRLFGYGVVLLPAFGYGVLLWLWALRLMLVKAPADDMQRALDAGG